MRRRRLVTVVAAAVLAATWPSAALAAAVTMPMQPDGLHMTYIADLGETNSVTLTTSGDQIVLTQDGPTQLTASMMGQCTGPTGTDPKVVSCTNTGVTQIDLTLRDGDDVLTNRTAFNAQASGEDGHDVIQGGSGNEQYQGGPGPDTIDGGDGNDRIFGATLQSPAAGIDSDVLSGGAGDDLVVAAGGADRVAGGPGVDQLQGNAGPDTLMGGDGNDTEDGGVGDDTIGTEVGAGVGQDLGNDALSGGPGNDALIPGPGSQLNDADAISGGDGFDWVTYGARMTPVSVSKNGAADDGGVTERDNVGFDVERISGGLASDTLVGGPDPDRLEGNPGDDSVAGLGGDDTLLGDAGASGGDDTLSGGPGNDDAQGEAGADTVSGEAGADSVQGGAGRDTLSGGPDPDQVLGGPDRDVLAYSTEPDVTVRLEAGTATTGLPNDVDRIDEIEDVRGGSERDTITGSDEENALSGNAQEDYLDGLRGVDSLDGGDNPDVVVARDGARDETVACGRGRDFAIVDRRDRVERRGNARCERVYRGGRRPRPGLVYVRPRRCGDAGVQFSLPAMHRLVPLRYNVLLPSGYRRRRAPTIDTSSCPLRVTAARGKRRKASGDVSGGAVTVAQSSGRRVATTLTVARPACAGGARSTAAAQGDRRVRFRTRKRRGNWRVKGNFSLGASEGTDWTTVESCSSTTTIVRRGRVRVTDFAKRRTVTVRAGERYVARRKAPPGETGSSG